MKEISLLKWHLRRLSDPNERGFDKYAKGYSNGDVIMTDGVLAFKLRRFLERTEADKYIGVHGGLVGLNSGPKVYPDDKTLKRIFRGLEPLAFMAVKTDELKEAMNFHNGEIIALSMVDGIASLTNAEDRVLHHRPKLVDSKGNVCITFKKQRMLQVIKLSEQLKTNVITLEFVGSYYPIHIKIGKHRAILAPTKGGV